MLPSTNIAAVPATLRKIIENYLTNLVIFKKCMYMLCFLSCCILTMPFFLVVIFQQFDWFSEWLKPDPFSRKTFRRRVLQKIVGVSHTTHIPHISSTFYISHTYPFQTYPPHISHTYPAHCTYPTHIHSKRIPHIRIPSVRIHAMRIHSKGCHTYPTNHHQYPIHIQHIIHIPHISISNVSIPNVSHQYVSIANVSIQKVCISRNRKRIPPIHIPPIRIFNTYPTSTDPFNAYPFKKFASAGMALSMSITAYHFIPFIPLLLGGNGNEYKNLAFPSILCKIIN